MRGRVNKLRKLTTIMTVRFWRDAWLRFGVAAAVEHKDLLAELSPQVVVDIGANRGQFSLAARYSLPTAQIIAFEPLPEPAAVFRKLFRKDPNVVLHEVAIGPKAGTETIHISRRDDSSSLLPITEQQETLFPGTAERSTSEISISPLIEYIPDGSIEGPALLKLDVQGYELEVLKGCEMLFERFGLIYVECSFVELYEGQAMAAEVVEYLHERGFWLTGIYNLKYDTKGVAIQGDFLFAKKSAGG
jgi:FkbM family methyltransferase